MLINLHNRCLITAAIAVVWRTEDCNHISILAPIISFHDQLVSSSDQRQPVVVIKRLGDILAKSVSSSSRTNAPAAPIVRVAPQQVAHWAFMWYLLDAIKTANVVEGVDAGREATMEAEDLVVDKSGEGEIIEEVCEIFPNICVAIFSQAFVVEAIHLGDLS